MTQKIEQAYALAKEQYAAIGVDTEKAMKVLAGIPISLHCWQGDDVGGFENAGSLDGGIAATGNYPGKASTPAELRADLECALSFIPGTHRLNLHAFYAEMNGKKVDRNELGPEQFQNWFAWCKEQGLGFDFNPTYFSHPKASDGLTLSHQDEGIRKFWVEHGIACRKIGEAAGKFLGTTCMTNFWIPDGMKDTPVDRLAPRKRLEKSLDEIFSVKIDKNCDRDAVESKLFGIGCESYTVGSHEFYLGYATKNQIAFTLDTGHYHPTETITDKISSSLMFVPELMLHVSRGVRWDSDHVVTLTDDLKAISEEIVRNDLFDKVHIGLDYFDASINRIAAWAIGVRAMLKSLLIALLEPVTELKACETSGDYTSRLALLEEQKSMPFAAVWDYYCEQKGAPVGRAWLAAAKKYEADVLSKRA